MGAKLTYSINENFFKTWNSKMAYILGFSFADGSLYDRTISWEIQKRDREILEKINSTMNSNYPIKLTKEKKKYVKLRIFNPSIIQDLKVFGLSNVKKSREFPIVPDVFLKDFIRGFLDGDGYISLRTKKLEICVGFSNCSRKFLKSLVKKLNSKINLSVNNLRSKIKITKKGKISKVYQIDWYAENSIKIIRFLYDDLLEDDLFFNRKFIKQLEARKIFNQSKKSKLQRKIEKKFEIPIELLLNRLRSNERLDIIRIARILKISNATAYRWLIRYRIITSSVEKRSLK